MNPFFVFYRVCSISPRPLPARRAYRPEGRLSEPEASIASPILPEEMIFVDEKTITLKETESAGLNTLPTLDTSC